MKRILVNDGAAGLAKPLAAMGYEVQQPNQAKDAITPKNLTKLSKLTDFAVKGMFSLPESGFTGVGFISL